MFLNRAGATGTDKSIAQQGQSPVPHKSLTLVVLSEAVPQLGTAKSKDPYSA